MPPALPDKGTPPPRIALLYDCAYPFVPGGGQKRLFEICRRLVGMGWQVDWYSFKSWPEPGEVTVEGIRFIPVARAPGLYGEDGKRSIVAAFRYGLAIAHYPGLGRYDVIHMGQWPYFQFFPARFYSLFGKARLSVDWWEVWGEKWLEYYGAKGRLGILLELICSRIPSRLIAISETGARDLAELGVPQRRIDVVHNGIDYQRIRTSDLAPRSRDLVYLGRLQPHKNVDCLIRALGKLRDRGASHTLAIIGDGPQRASLEALTAELGLGGQVEFLGMVKSDDEVYALLKAAKVFVHPSTKEGGGSITSLEANAAGLPVVAFRHPGGISPELIQEGLNGHWAGTVGDDALADVIDHALASHRGEATARQCAAFAERFDWYALALQYADFFARNLADV